VPADQEQKVKGILGWYQAKMATPGQQVFRMLYDTSAFSTKPTNASVEKWKDDMLQCLKSLDEKLAAANFLCGSKMSVGDIVVFNELS